jgi:hypothetical protein
MVQRKLQRAKRTKQAKVVRTPAVRDESRLYGEYVARDRSGRILVHAATGDALFKAIKKKHLQLSDVIIDRIRPRDAILIL